MNTMRHHDGMTRQSSLRTSTPKSTQQLYAWFSYGLAAEVFAVCGVGSFLPVTLEQLARERGVLLSATTTPCVTYASKSAAAGPILAPRALDSNSDGQCIIRPFGRDMATASFAMYTFSIAVIVQALCFVSFSSFADHGNHRKKMLLFFGFTGATSCMLFLLVGPNLYLLGPLLVIIGVTCLGSSFVLLNSYLPLLVSYHLPVHTGSNGVESFDEACQSSSRSRSSDSSQTHSHSQANLQLSTNISSKGVGYGYCAAVFVQCLSILVLYGFGKTRVSETAPSLPLRVVLFMVGVWWFGFTIPAACWLRAWPGPPLNVSTSHKSIIRWWLTYVSFAWVSLWTTVKTAFRLRQARLFLLAWFLLSDAVATVSGTAILFARTELKMGNVAIAILSITATSSGIAGAFLWPRISKRLRLKTGHTIIGCTLLMEIIPIYGLLGFVPFVKAWGVGGLQKAWEVYPLAIIHGFVMGGLSSYCRSFFAILIPSGHEAAFYALYAFTDKGSSAIGPAIVGAIVDFTGTIRPAFGFLAVLISLPGPLIWLIDAESGRHDALALSLKAAEGATHEMEVRSAQSHEEFEGLLTHDP